MVAVDRLCHTREIDCAVVVSVDLVDHVLQFGFGGVLAEGTHDGAQFLGCDLTYSDIVNICS